MNGWIWPIGGVASERLCACIHRIRLVVYIASPNTVPGTPMWLNTLIYRLMLYFRTKTKTTYLRAPHTVPPSRHSRHGTSPPPRPQGFPRDTSCRKSPCAARKKQFLKQGIQLTRLGHGQMEEWKVQEWTNKRLKNRNLVYSFLFDILFAFVFCHFWRI